MTKLCAVCENSSEVTLFHQASLVLGEGPYWDPGSRSLFLVDIDERKLIRIGLSGDYSEWIFSEKISWIAGSSEAGYLVGMRSGIARLSLSPVVDVTYLAEPFSEMRDIRLNDAKVDSDGVVWGGFMLDPVVENSDGGLFRFCVDEGFSIVDHGYGIPNGPAIEQGRAFLHTDSMKRIVYKLQLSEDRRTVVGRDTWLRLEAHEGVPDGMTYDSEGNIWLAHWGTGWVSCYSEDATLLKRFSLPVSQASSVCFGGELLDRLFVTTARQGLSSIDLANEPLAGSVFEIHGHGASGCPMARSKDRS